MGTAPIRRQSVTTLLFLLATGYGLLATGSSLWAQDSPQYRVDAAATAERETE